MTAGPWISTPSDDVEDAPCQRCGKDVHLQHHEPCPHGLVACPECGWEAVCIDCRKRATDEMFASGEWSEAGDPLYDQAARTAESDAAFLERTALPGFDPGTNSYTPRRTA